MNIGDRVKHITEGKLGKIVNASSDWNLVLWDDGNFAPEGNEALEVIKEDVGRIQEELELDQDKILGIMKTAGWGDAVVNNMTDFEGSKWFKNPQTEEEYARQFDMYMNAMKVGHVEEEVVPGVDPAKTPTLEEPPTAEPLPVLKPQDKITIGGIPTGDQDAGYNGKQAVVVSVDPAGTTLNIGGQNVKFNKPQYLKKMGESVAVNEMTTLIKEMNKDASEIQDKGTN
jgi:hypothetical protein